jgi:hypothetical protein
MPSTWITTAVSDILATRKVRLRDGWEYDFSALPGSGFDASRLALINAAIQAAVDTRIPLSDLPETDPDKRTNPNRPTLYWSDASGNPSPTGAYLCARHTRVWLEWDGAKLIPHTEEVR